MPNDNEMLKIYLPSDIGDTIYYIVETTKEGKNSFIRPCKITSFIYQNDSMYYMVEYDYYNEENNESYKRYGTINLEDYCKTWFRDYNVAKLKMDTAKKLGRIN